MSTSWLGLLGALAIVGGLLVFLDRMLVARDRHWELDDDERPRSPTIGVGNALMELHEILQPGAKAGIEEMQKQLAEQDGEGDPPDRDDDRATG